MRKIYNAFTLAEVAIVFVIIGIISILAISTIKPWNKAAKFAYMRMYNAIGLATYNHTLKNDTSMTFPETPTKLCEALVEFMNVASDEADNCKGDILGVSPEDTDFETAKPMFTASNGAYIWIGADGNKPFVLNQTFASGESDTVSYYMVYVDLNGDHGPNSAVWDIDDLSDIVAYVVTDKFVVVPVGYPEVDARYLVANVVYPSIAETAAEAGEAVNITDDDDDEVISDPMSFYEAKVKAYGTISAVDQSPLPVFGEVLTYDFAKDFPDTSSFKIEDYALSFPTAPEQDPRCVISGYDYSVCNVKIYDYH